MLFIKTGLSSGLPRDRKPNGSPSPHYRVPTKSGPKDAHLPAPADLLVKNPKLIADPVPVGGQAQCRHGVQKAG